MTERQFDLAWAVAVIGVLALVLVLVVTLSAALAFASDANADGSSWYGEKPPVTIPTPTTGGT